MPGLKVLSPLGCSDVVGDIASLAACPKLEELRLNGRKRLHGDVEVFRVPAPGA